MVRKDQFYPTKKSFYHVRYRIQPFHGLILKFISFVIFAMSRDRSARDRGAPFSEVTTIFSRNRATTSFFFSRHDSIFFRYNFADPSLECFTLNNWGIFPQIILHDIVVFAKKVEYGTGVMQVYIRLLRSQTNRMEVIQTFKLIFSDSS